MLLLLPLRALLFVDLSSFCDVQLIVLSSFVHISQRKRESWLLYLLQNSSSPLGFFLVLSVIVKFPVAAHIHVLRAHELRRL